MSFNEPCAESSLRNDVSMHSIVSTSNCKDLDMTILEENDDYTGDDEQAFFRNEANIHKSVCSGGKVGTSSIQITKKTSKQGKNTKII
jgi:hypothetical protein